MDCVRNSTDIRDEYFEGDYTEVISLRGKSVEVCQRSCISDLDCQGWRYTPDGSCSFTEKVGWHTQPSPSGTVSGRVECEDQWDMLKLMLWILIFGLILMAVWYYYFMRRQTRR